MSLPTIRRAFADLADGQIHFAASGSQQAPAVLLLHQTPRSWAEYRHVLPLLGRHYRVIAMDTMGFGDSAAPPWPASIERWAGVAAQLLDALGIARAHLVGHHTGGVIALELAAALPHRVHGLVLSSTPYTNAAFRLERATRPAIDHVEPSSDGSHLAALWRKRQGFYPAGRPELLEAFVSDALKARGELDDGHRAVAAYRMEERITLVHAPTLLIRAPADPFASKHAAELQIHLPHARLVEIDGGMVPLPDQLPEAFANAVLEFLDSLE